MWLCHFVGHQIYQYTIVNLIAFCVNTKCDTGNHSIGLFDAINVTGIDMMKRL